MWVLFFCSAWCNPLPSLLNARLSPPSQYLNCSRVGNSGLLQLAPVSFWCIILWSLPYFLPKPAVPGSPCIFLVPKLGIVHFPRWPWFLVLGMILKTKIWKKLKKIKTKICWAHYFLKCHWSQSFEQTGNQHSFVFKYIYRGSKQSILKEINPEYSLERLMLKLKLQYFGHLIQRADSFGKDPDAGKDWRQEQKRETDDEVVGWHHRLDGLEFEQTLGDSWGQGSLACCGTWGCKELDRTERQNDNNSIYSRNHPFPLKSSSTPQEFSPSHLCMSLAENPTSKNINVFAHWLSAAKTTMQLRPGEPQPTYCRKPGLSFHFCCL